VGRRKTRISFFVLRICSRLHNSLDAAVVGGIFDSRDTIRLIDAVGRILLAIPLYICRRVFLLNDLIALFEIQICCRFFTFGRLTLLLFLAYFRVWIVLWCQNSAFVVQRFDCMEGRILHIREAWLVQRHLLDLISMQRVTVIAARDDSVVAGLHESERFLLLRGSFAVHSDCWVYGTIFLSGFESESLPIRVQRKGVGGLDRGSWRPDEVSLVVVFLSYEGLWVLHSSLGQLELPMRRKVAITTSDSTIFALANGVTPRRTPRLNRPHIHWKRQRRHQLIIILNIVGKVFLPD